MRLPKMIADFKAGMDIAKHVKECEVCLAKMNYAEHLMFEVKEHVVSKH